MGEPTKGWHVNQFTIPEDIDEFSEIKLPIIRRFEDADGDLWQFEQDIEFVDNHYVKIISNEVIELQFTVKWKDEPDGLPEPK